MVNNVLEMDLNWLVPVEVPCQISRKKLSDAVSEVVRKNGSARKDKKDSSGVEKPIEPKANSKKNSPNDYKPVPREYVRNLILLPKDAATEELHDPITKRDFKKAFSILTEREDLRQENDISLGSKLWQILFKKITSEAQFYEGLNRATLPENTRAMTRAFAVFGRNHLFCDDLSRNANREEFKARIANGKTKLIPDYSFD